MSGGKHIYGCQIGVDQNRDGTFTVTISAPVEDGDFPWWKKAAAGRAWTINTVSVRQADYLVATRRCRHLAAARAIASRSRKQLQRDLYGPARRGR